VRHDKEILIANTPTDFVEGCCSLLTDPARRERIGRAARDFFLANLSWDAIEPAVRATVESCLERQGPP
jgi:glycosyltransferase involved in cell wall biosynthesis